MEVIVHDYLQTVIEVNVFLWKLLYMTKFVYGIEHNTFLYCYGSYVHWLFYCIYTHILVLFFRGLYITWYKTWCNFAGSIVAMYTEKMYKWQSYKQNDRYILYYCV